MTNLQKFIEIMNTTFNAGFTPENMKLRCSPCGILKKAVYACQDYECRECQKWWSKEYSKEYSDMSKSEAIMSDDEPIPDFELEAMIATAERERKDGGYYFWRVERALKELKARRKAEKEQIELQYFTRGVIENGRLYMDIPTDDKKPVETNLESVKPLPVKRCKIKGVKQDVSKLTVKQWFQKINEELDEFKREIVVGNGLRAVPITNNASEVKIKEEAMDTITAITSMLEAMGIDEEQRNEAQRLVNEKNRKRGRL